MARDLFWGVADAEGDVGDEPVAAANEGALYERARVREVENPGHDVLDVPLRMCEACALGEGRRNERRRGSPHL